MSNLCTHMTMTSQRAMHVVMVTGYHLLGHDTHRVHGVCLVLPLLCTLHHVHERARWNRLHVVATPFRRHLEHLHDQFVISHIRSRNRREVLNNNSILIKVCYQMKANDINYIQQDWWQIKKSKVKYIYVCVCSKIK